MQFQSECSALWTGTSQKPRKNPSVEEHESGHGFSRADLVSFLDSERASARDIKRSYSKDLCRRLKSAKDQTKRSLPARPRSCPDSCPSEKVSSSAACSGVPQERRMNSVLAGGGAVPSEPKAESVFRNVTTRLKPCPFNARIQQPRNRSNYRQIPGRGVARARSPARSAAPGSSPSPPSRFPRAR